MNRKFLLQTLLVLALLIGAGAAATNTLAIAPSRPLAASGIATFHSVGRNDGYVREYLDDYWLGNQVESRGPTMYVGDDAAKRLMIGILDFDTSTLPDSATVTYATLQVRVKSLNTRYGDPYINLGDMYADITAPYFGNSTALESIDFESFALGFAGAFSPAFKANEWIYLDVDLLALGLIDPTAHTQFKVYFFDDNDDDFPQGITFISGNYPTVTYRPTLTVYYDVP